MEGEGEREGVTDPLPLALPPPPELEVGVAEGHREEVEVPEMDATGLPLVYKDREGAGVKDVLGVTLTAAAVREGKIVLEPLGAAVALGIKLRLEAPLCVALTLGDLLGVGVTEEVVEEVPLPPPPLPLSSVPDTVGVGPTLPVPPTPREGEEDSLGGRVPMDDSLGECEEDTEKEALGEVLGVLEILGLPERVGRITVLVGVGLPEVEGLGEAREDTEALLDATEALAEELEEGHAEGVVGRVGAGDTVVLTDRDLEMVVDTVEVVVAQRVKEIVGVEVPPTLDREGRFETEEVMDKVREAVEVGDREVEREDVGERVGLEVPERVLDWVMDIEGEGVVVVDMVNDDEGVAEQTGF